MCTSVSELFEGSDIAAAVSLGKLACKDGVLDVDLTLGSGSRSYSLRLVAVETKEKGLCVFLTNLARKTIRLVSWATSTGFAGISK